jgi:hypothetical protein
MIAGTCESIPLDHQEKTEHTSFFLYIRQFFWDNTVLGTGLQLSAFLAAKVFLAGSAQGNRDLRRDAVPVSESGRLWNNQILSVRFAVNWSYS